MKNSVLIKQEIKDNQARQDELKAQIELLEIEQHDLRQKFEAAELEEKRAKRLTTVQKEILTLIREGRVTYLSGWGNTIYRLHDTTLNRKGLDRTVQVLMDLEYVTRKRLERGEYLLSVTSAGKVALNNP